MLKKKSINLIAFLQRSSSKNPLFLSSLILYAGFMYTNMAGYFYHFLMARILGAADYGALDSLISLLYFLGVPMGTLGLVIVKFSSSFKGKQDGSAIKSMFSVFSSKTLLVALIGLLIFALSIPLLASFLHLKSYSALGVIGLISFVAVFVTINRSFLQGMLRFVPLSLSMVFEATLKLTLSIIFVLLGLHLFGAVLPILVGGIVAYFFTSFVLRKTFKKEKVTDDINYKQMGRYAVPVFISMMAFTSLYTIDVVLARHFLDPMEAGYYASLSVLGRIIFFAASPISMVVFPMISEKFARGENYNKLLFLSLLLVSMIGAVISLIYLIFPSLMIGLLFGKEFLPAASNLFIFAVFIGLYSIAYLFNSFYLSIHQTKVVLLPLIGAVMQIVGLYLFHNNISEIIWVSLIVNALLLVSQLIYYVVNQVKFTLGAEVNLAKTKI